MMSKRIYSRIAGTGSYLPEKVLTNADLENGRNLGRVDPVAHRHS